MPSDREAQNFGAPPITNNKRIPFSFYQFLKNRNCIDVRLAILTGLKEKNGSRISQLALKAKTSHGIALTQVEWLIEMKAVELEGDWTYRQGVAFDIVLRRLEEYAKNRDSK